MWDTTPAGPTPTPHAPVATSVAAPKRDLTALMYGGSTPLFDTGAIEEADESDDEGEDFLRNLKDPSKTNEPKAAASGGAAAPKKKVKSKNPFGSSSDEDDYAANKNKAGGGY